MLKLSRKITFLANLILFSGFLTTTLASEVSYSIRLNISQQTAMSMQTEKAKPVEFIPSAIYPAQAMLPLQTIRILSSPLSGQIIKLNYVHGLIEKGFIIAEIESPELLRIQKDFLVILSDLNISRQNLKRAKELNQSGISSTKKLQQAHSEVKKLTLNKNQIKKNLHIIGMSLTAIKTLEKKHQLQPASLYIKSPIDGQLFDLQVKLGERLTKNQSIISLGETTPMILVVRVPVSTANKIHRGQKIKIESNDLLSNGKIGIVKHIDFMVDPMTQSVDIHIQVENSDNSLRSGQLFKVRFLTRHKQKVYQVSANAISHYKDKTVVYIQLNNSIQTLPIEVVNITNKLLYFSPKIKYSLPLKVYIKGSTAIKSALNSSKAPKQ